MSKLLKYVVATVLFLPLVAWANLNADETKSSAVESKNLIFVSGQRTGLMEVPDDGKALREAFDKIREIAKKNNATMDDVVQMTVFLADPTNDYPRLRGIVSEYFTNPGDIARSVVGVSRIPDNDSVNFSINRRVEIDAVIAVKKTK
jgi:enamine deaminase RidA (YjgF/YER057c/UK114 family)